LILPLLMALTLGGNSSTDSLRAAIEARIRQSPGVEVGVAYVDLQTGDTLYMSADTLFHAASTMKVPVMLQLFRRVSEGALRLDQDLLLVNQFSSIVDGSSYKQEPGDDSDSAMYKLIGTRVRIDTLIRHMITRSSNLATNTLIALAGPDQIKATLASLGIHRMLVLRGVQDLKAFDKGMNNLTTARDLATLFTAIEKGTAADATATVAMKGILLAQEFNSGIPAGIPAGIQVAHKTGDLTAHNHDAGIVYPSGRKPYVLAVLTRGLQKQSESSALIADISRLIYAHAMLAAVPTP
jgi:beta-lactamase class A